MRDLVNEWLAATQTRDTPQSYPFAPRLTCADGLNLSVQASGAHYCSPRQNDGPWSAVEIGFPTERVDEFMPYIDGDPDTENPLATVYGYVPVSIVAAVIEKHGGLSATSLAKMESEVTA